MYMDTVIRLGFRGRTICSVTRLSMTNEIQTVEMRQELEHIRALLERNIVDRELLILVPLITSRVEYARLEDFVTSPITMPNRGLLMLVPLVASRVEYTRYQDFVTSSHHRSFVFLLSISDKCN